MNREIKFRAWNGKQIRGIEKNDFFSIRNDGMTSIRLPDPDFEPVLMQFTGIKDKNGVDIYEGDYVSIFDSSDSDFMMCGVVKYGVNGYPAFEIYDKKGRVYCDEFNTFTNDNDLSFKVVGNIYQTPELLERLK